jgi:hypothetical protein
MLDEKILKQIISDYEQILSIVSNRLEIIRHIADAAGIKTISTQHVENKGFSIKEDIEKRRRELMADAEKIRSEAMAKAQQVAEQAGRYNAGMDSGTSFPVVNMPTMPVPPMGSQSKNDKK